MPKTITSVLLRPDTTNGTPVPAVTPGLWQRAQDTIAGLLHTGWLIYALAGTLALLLALSLRARHKRTKAEAAGQKSELTRTDRAVTRLTGILATAVVATGAWKVFGDVLHLHPAIRLVLFFFAEAQIVAAWRRVRRHIYRHAQLGPGIKTIYGIAFGSALVAAFDADNGVEVLLRFFAAGVAAYMIAEELAEELDIYLTAHPHLATTTRKPRGRINWANHLERALVWLRLAEATDRTIAEVERQRRISQLARMAYRLQLLKDRKAGKLVNARTTWVRWRLRRLTEAANEHLGLATNQALLTDLRAQAALLYGAEDGMSRHAVRDQQPWQPTQPDAPVSAQPIHRAYSAKLARRSQRANQKARTSTRRTLARTFAREYAPANQGALAPAKVAANPAASTPASARAKGAKPPRDAYNAATGEGPESVRKLAAAFARKPTGTNAELAKLAKVSIGSANRHLPKIRARAAANATDGDSQERTQPPLITARIENPKPLVTQRVNGSTYPSQEN